MTTTFYKEEFSDKRTSNYFRSYATNFDIRQNTATAANFQSGLSRSDAVSVYFGHSDGISKLRFNGDDANVSDFQVKNRVVCFAACNTAQMLKDVKIGKGQALIGVTSNLTVNGVPGTVRAGDLQYIATQIGRAEDGTTRWCDCRRAE